ncbi:hypothetical protein B0T25DRAFT_174990 [Lasiosphaeria hispida]|uniref:Uncharacterized protein n=1 Tax=Lasiosphaeria hispida TaxID=260671 RepID=A0AAJ0MGN0_9PEZI|nr:hypothetical protein B0T25DRAFT_174990 [Lasiosphaeria hispida]
MEQQPSIEHRTRKGGEFSQAKQPESQIRPIIALVTGTLGKLQAPNPKSPKGSARNGREKNVSLQNRTRHPRLQGMNRQGPQAHLLSASRRPKYSRYCTVVWGYLRSERPGGCDMAMLTLGVQNTFRSCSSYTAAPSTFGVRHSATYSIAFSHQLAASHPIRHSSHLDASPIRNCTYPCVSMMDPFRFLLCGRAQGAAALDLGRCAGRLGS